MNEPKFEIATVFFPRKEILIKLFCSSSPIHRILLSLCMSDVTSALLSTLMIYGTINGHVGGNYTGILLFYVRKGPFL